jgi:hypothetical protein
MAALTINRGIGKGFQTLQRKDIFTQGHSHLEALLSFPGIDRQASKSWINQDSNAELLQADLGKGSHGPSPQMDGGAQE